MAKGNEMTKWLVIGTIALAALWLLPNALANLMNYWSQLKMQTAVLTSSNPQSLLPADNPTGSSTAGTAQDQTGVGETTVPITGGGIGNPPAPGSGNWLT